MRWITLNLFREVYYRHLQTANEGDVRPFIRLPFLVVLLYCSLFGDLAERCVQVYSAVHRKNPGSLPVGKSGVHYGGGGGWVYQSSTQPCRGFDGGGWHGCEEVTSILYLCNTRSLWPGTDRVRSNTGWIWRRRRRMGTRGAPSGQVYKACLEVGGEQTASIGLSHAISFDSGWVMEGWRRLCWLWTRMTLSCDHFCTLKKAKLNLETVINVMKLLCWL